MTHISLNSTLEKPQETLIDNPSMLSACFPVSKFNLGFQPTPGELVTIDKMAIVRQDTQECLHVCSRSYNLVKNEDIILGLEPLHDLGYENVKVRNLYNRRFYFELRSRASEIKVNNYPCVARIRVINSYDGTAPLSLQFGVFIQVCGNGALANIAGLHTLDLKYKHSKVVPEDVSAWIHATTMEALPYVRNQFESMTFDDEPCDDILTEINKMFPQTKKTPVHPIVSKLIEYTKVSIKEYACNEKFGLFMALTNMATYPDNYEIAPAYVDKLESASQFLFTN